MPAVYNLACAGLLPERFAVLGVALDAFPEEEFRARLAGDVRRHSTQPTWDEPTWGRLAERLHYLPGEFGDAATFARLAERARQLDAQYHTAGNRLFYL